VSYTTGTATGGVTGIPVPVSAFVFSDGQGSASEQPRLLLSFFTVGSVETDRGRR